MDEEELIRQERKGERDKEIKKNKLMKYTKQEEARKKTMITQHLSSKNKQTFPP